MTTTVTPVLTARPSASPGVDRPDWLDYEEFPFRSRFVDVDGNRIHYVDEGTGPTLLFVHAGPAWSFVFRDVIDQLRHGFRCVALDFPGSGLSGAAPDYEPTIENASAVLESFLDTVGIDEATLVAHDVGGPVAFGVAALRPDLFRGMGIVGSFGWPLAEEFPGVARFLRLVGGPVFGLLDAYLGLLARLTARFGVGRRLSPRGRRVFRTPYRDRRTRRFATAMLGDVLRSEAYLATVHEALTTTLADRPVLLLFGEGDAGREAGFQERWEALYPDAHSAVVEGADHFPMADSPHLVAETVAAWWAEEFGDASEALVFSDSTADPKE